MAFVRSRTSARFSASCLDRGPLFCSDDGLGNDHARMVALVQYLAHALLGLISVLKIKRIQQRLPQFLQIADALMHGVGATLRSASFFVIWRRGSPTADELSRDVADHPGLGKLVNDLARARAAKLINLSTISSGVAGAFLQANLQFAFFNFHFAMMLRHRSLAASRSNFNSLCNLHLLFQAQAGQRVFCWPIDQPSPVNFSRLSSIASRSR